MALRRPTERHRPPRRPRQRPCSTQPAWLAASSSSSGAISSSISPHYDAQRDVVLCLESLREPEVKVRRMVCQQRQQNRLQGVCS